MQTAAYYFPNFHVDPLNEAVHGPGWTEWELMKCARPRYPGHDQPKVPLWGYGDEADPAVMAQKIEAAADHGLDAFIFDWYWYDQPFLERALTQGYLQAPNRDRLKFALMWANHDWRNFHPASRTQPYPVSHVVKTTLATVGQVWDYIIDNFMLRPEYWRVDGKPYFSLYAMNRFIIQMGGVQAAAEAIALLREKACRAGLPGVYISTIWFDVLEGHPNCSECPQTDWFHKIGIDCYTSYNNTNINKAWFTENMQVDYDANSQAYLQMCRKAISTLPAPYYPVLTVGWDSSPRTVQSEVYECNKVGYPYIPFMVSTPESFGRAIDDTLALLAEQPENRRLLFINAWNEWTEGSYLEPDTKYGMAFLQELKKRLSARA